jgi:hypothetical protein
MAADPRSRTGRQRYTVLAEPIESAAWHLTVRELPETWTVAFTEDEIDARARQRIAFDLALDPSDVDVSVVRDRDGRT